MIKSLRLALGASAMLLASCGGGTITKDVTEFTVTFDSRGGSAVPSQTVKLNERVTRPADPTKAGFDFDGWFKDTYCVTPFEFATKITSDWTIYAGWTSNGGGGGSSSQGGSSSEESSSSTETSSEESSESSSSGGITTPEYPAGSVAVEWWIAGEGASFSGWSTSGGVQLHSNPSSATDKGCVLNLTINEGDVFQFTNGSVWSGKIDSYDDPRNAGLTNFRNIDNGFGELTNIECTVSGVYDIYVNSSNVLWIQLH